MAELDSLRSQVLGRSAGTIQRKYRSHLARKSFISLCSAAVHIQALCRGQVTRLRYECRRREAAALYIQKVALMFMAKRSYEFLCSSAILVQAGIRGTVVRNKLRLRKQTKAAVIVQSHWRGYSACSQYLWLKAAAIATQCAWRARMARKELRKLKMASKESGALREAKIKLEIHIEELTWQLQLEKQMRADIEEAKNREIAKLQSSLKEIQLQFQESKERSINECEPSIFVHEQVNKLTAENERLKTLVRSLENKIDETEKKLEETSKISEDQLKQILEAESKIIQLKTNMQRLEEKLSDMESEQHILQQQALINSPAGKVSGRLVPKTTPADNGNFEFLRATPSKKIGTEFDNKMRRSNIERQRENVDALIRCITENLGFSEGKPVCAFTIYKCLIHWKSFEADKTSVFDRLIQNVGTAIQDEANTDHIAYWLSNTSTLLFLLQQTLKATSSTPKKPPQPTSFFGRISQGFRSSPSSSHLSVGGLDGIFQVEAKYPALLFKEQLTAYVEKIYGIIRDNSKKELSSLISLCTQAPQPSGGSFSCSSPKSNWKSITKSLNGILTAMKDNFVPPVLVQKIFTQIFSYINVQLFNSLLLRKDCCTFSNGEQIKSGLDELELWCGHAEEEYAGSSWDELKHIRQAVGFLVIHQKSRITYEDLATDLCPALSIQQLYRICTLYWDDNYDTCTVSPDVISSIKIQMTEDANEADSKPFLLDENSSIPFSIDDICNSLQESDFRGVKPAAELLENPAFDFLL